MELKQQAKLVKALLGSAIVALISTIVLAAVSVSGVTDMAVAGILLWIAFAVLVLSMLATAILVWIDVPSNKSRAIMVSIALLTVIASGIGRDRLFNWLQHKKSESSNNTPQPPRASSGGSSILPPQSNNPGVSPEVAFGNGVLRLSAEILQYQSARGKNIQQEFPPVQPLGSDAQSMQNFSKVLTEYNSELNRRTGELDTQFDVTFGADIRDALGRLPGRGITTERLWTLYQKKQEQALGNALRNIGLNLTGKIRGRHFDQEDLELLGQRFRTTQDYSDPRFGWRATIHIYSASCSDCRQFAEQILEAAKTSRWEIEGDVHPIPASIGNVSGVRVAGNNDGTMPTFCAFFYAMGYDVNCVSTRGPNENPFEAAIYIGPNALMQR